MATVLYFAWREKLQVLYMKIYKYSMRFKVPALYQSDCSICYNYDLNSYSCMDEFFNRKIM